MRILQPLCLMHQEPHQEKDPGRAHFVCLVQVYIWNAQCKCSTGVGEASKHVRVAAAQGNALSPPAESHHAPCWCLGPQPSGKAT